MALKIKPLADRVLIEPVAAETKTASGIIIPDNAKEKPQQGKVMAVGKGTKDEPMTVKNRCVRNFLRSSSTCFSRPKNRMSSSSSNALSPGNGF